MRRTKNGSTDKQKAYAQRRLLGIAGNKKQTALSVGFSPSTANSVSVKIEKTEGYANAVRDLAEETSNLVLASYNVLKNRDLSKEPTLVVLKSIDTLANAWKVFSNDKKQDYDQPENRLRFAINQHIQHQTITVKNDEPEKAI